MLADDTSPVYLAGIFQGAPAVFGLTPRIVEGFRTGQGVGWHEHGQALFEGTERFFRSGYRANLVSEWIPALEGVEAKLQTGAAVADVGCGHGASTLLLAEAFPNSTFVGYDYHQASIDAARARAADAGLPADRVSVRSRRRRRLSRHLRRRRHLRRSPRHGRPARGRAPRARVADAGRHVHAVRAGGRRPGQRQPQPGRPAVLRDLHHGLHTGVVGPARSAWPSGPRPDRPDSGRSSPRPGSPEFARPPAPRSTSFSKAGPDREAARSRTTACTLRA